MLKLWKSTAPYALLAGISVGAAILYHGDGWKSALFGGVYFAAFLLLVVTIGALFGAAIRLLTGPHRGS